MEPIDNLPPVRGAQPLIAFDILRAAAAILVVMEHTRSLAFISFGVLPAAQQTIAAKLLFLVSRLGQEAVLLFFVLSGFLVGGQVIRRVRASRFDIRDYAIDRVARIMLPLVPAVFFAAIVGVALYGVKFDAGQVIGHLAGLNGVIVETMRFNAPLWSLPYEIWFYVLAGVIAVAGVGRGGLFALLAGLAAMLVFCRLDASLILIWSLGAVVSALTIRRGRGLLALAGLVVMVAGSAAIQMSRPSETMAVVGPLSLAMARGIFSVGFAMTIPWLISPGVNDLLSRWKPIAAVFAFLAGMSYSLYLFHHPLLAILAKLVMPAGISMTSVSIYLGSIMLCVAFSAAMYWLFERNTARVRNWLKARAIS